MDKSFSVIMAIIVGICQGVQSPINAALGKVITPKVAAFNSVLVSTIIMFLIVLFSGTFKEYSNIKNISPLYWIGGVFGIAIVFLSIKVIPILGTTSAFSIFIAVQLIVGVLLNQFGLLGVAKVPMDPVRFMGVILLLVAVKMVVR